GQTGVRFLVLARWLHLPLSPASKTTSRITLGAGTEEAWATKPEPGTVTSEPESERSLVSQARTTPKTIRNSSCKPEGGTRPPPPRRPPGCPPPRPIDAHRPRLIARLTSSPTRALTRRGFFSFPVE